MPEPGVHIETIQNPLRYSSAQLDRVCEIAHQLDRGKLVLCIPPAHAEPRDA